MKKILSTFFLTLLFGTILSFPITALAVTADPGVPITVQQDIPLITTLESELKIKKPVLEINIPKLDFSNATQNVDEEGYIHLPWIGEYISAIYKFAMVVASILAVIVIIISGARMMVSAGGEEKNAATKRLGQALVGLFICWGSYAILYNINPALVEFKALRIKYIEPISLPDLTTAWDFDSSQADIQIITDPNFHHKEVPKKYEITNELIKQIAQINNIDPCVAWTIIKKESGGDGLAVGHDENYPRGESALRPCNRVAKVPSRAKFLISGKKYNGELFSSVAGCMWGAKPTCSTPFNPCTMNQTNIYNNDGKNGGRTGADFSKPPDYGLDWRFSHGFGIGQMTIVPGSSYCGKIDGPNGLEWARKVGNNWYTVTDLLNPDKAVEATMTLIKELWAKAKGNRMEFWKYYAGDVGGVDRAEKTYNTCDI